MNNLRVPNLKVDRHFCDYLLPHQIIASTLKFFSSGGLRKNIIKNAFPSNRELTQFLNELDV